MVNGGGCLLHQRSRVRTLSGGRRPCHSRCHEDRTLRYQHLVVRKEAGGDPGSSVLRDRGMVTAILAWAAVAAVIIYWR